MKSCLVVALSATSLCLACAPTGGETDDATGEEDVAEAQSALAVQNANFLNGAHLNGSYLNGIQQNGIQQNGIQQNGIQQNGNGLQGVDSQSGLTVGGTGYTGATMVAVLGDTTQVTLTISSVSSSDVPGLYTYEITAGGVNVCGSTGAKAVLVPGGWNYVTASYVENSALFTVACRGAAIAKCTEWGYKEWLSWAENNGTTTQQVPLRYFHEACTRMVRADYCGDGVSHTENGTPIDVFDTANIQTETPTNTMPLEAEWTPSGAACIKHVRWTATNADPLTPTEDYINTHCPSRWAGPSSTSCGGSTSEYFTANGFKSSPTYVAPFATRPLLKNASDQHTH